MEFEWDLSNIEHLARHKVTPAEAEEGVLIDPLDVDLQEHSSENRVLCFGRTNSGRLLTVLYTERDGKTRVVTAYDMTKEQQELYFKGR